jgi:hypothetical protein
MLLRGKTRDASPAEPWSRRAGAMLRRERIRHEGLI